MADKSISYVNGVNDSIRKPSYSAFDVFLWHIHVFSDVNGVNGKVKKKNWEINDFFDVNGVNGKYTEKNLGDFFDVNGVNGIYIQKKNLGVLSIFNVNGVNGSIRGQTISAFEVFLWLIHVFSNVNGVNGKLEKKWGDK